MKNVTSPDDSRIENYRLVRERDLIGRQGMFIAEGEVVLRMLVQSPLMETLSVLIAEHRAESLRDTLIHLPNEVPIYLASQAVMDSIVGFPIHRGILALGRRRNISSASDLLKSLSDQSVILGLAGICNHDNMGGIFRNAAAFGVSAIIADASSCDPLYRKAIRVSVGGVFRVPFARMNVDEDMLSLFSQHGFASFALSPRGELELGDTKVSAKSAIILGSEGEGLPKEMVEHCQSTRITMATGVDSLNVATTSGIVLHHFVSQR